MGELHFILSQSSWRIEASSGPTRKDIDLTNTSGRLSSAFKSLPISRLSKSFPSSCFWDFLDANTILLYISFQFTLLHINVQSTPCSECQVNKIEVLSSATSSSDMISTSTLQVHWLDQSWQAAGWHGVYMRSFAILILDSSAMPWREALFDGSGLVCMAYVPFVSTAPMIKSRSQWNPSPRIWSEGMWDYCQYNSDSLTVCLIVVMLSNTKNI